MREGVIDPLVARRALARRLVGLYALTPDENDTGKLVAQARAAIAGGANALQYRNKHANEKLRAEQAGALAELCRADGALFIVNDHSELAASSHADGVHVGEEDGDLHEVRATVGDRRIIGVSCYDDVERARAAVARGADYVAFGSLFASSVKPGARHATLAVLREASGLGVPVVGIGGIDATNAARAIEAGADALAVITAVFGPGDPAGIEIASRRLARAIADAQAKTAS